MLKEGLRGAAVPKARAHQPRGTGGPSHAVVRAQGGPASGSSPQRLGTPAWGDGESCPVGGRCSRRTCEGQQPPKRGDTSLRGRGLVPRRWSVFKEGLRRAAAPKAQAHQPRGTGKPAQAVGVAQGRLARGSSPQGLGTPASGDGESSLGGGGAQGGPAGGGPVPKAQAHHPGGTGNPAQAVVGVQGGPAGGSSPQGPGTPAWGDGESCPGGGWCSGRARGG